MIIKKVQEFTFKENQKKIQYIYGFALQEVFMKRSLAYTLIIILFMMLSSCNILNRPTLPPAPTSFVPTRLTNTPKPEGAVKEAPDYTATIELPTGTFTPEPIPLESVWFTNEIDRVLLRFDPLTHTILERIQISGVPVALATSEDSVWVIESSGSEHSNILRIDKDINLVVTSIPIAQGRAVSIAIGQGSVWVGIAEPHEVDVAPYGGVEFFRPGGVVRIDEATNRIIEYIETSAVVADLFMEGHFLWTLEVRSIYTYFDKIDLVSRIIKQIPESIATSEFIHQFVQMTMSSNWLWTIARDESSRYIFRINPIDGKVEATIEMGENATDTPLAITASGNIVWVALNNGKVQKIDSSTDQIIASIDTGGNQLSDIFYASGSIWVISRTEGMVYQINPLTNDTIYSLSTGSKPPPTPTPTPTYTPDPSIPWSPCEDVTFLTRLTNGMRAKVSEEPAIANRVRIEPDNESLIVGYIQPGELVEIIAGPVCANGWIWWNVIGLIQGTTGWTSEGNGSEYWLIPVR